MPAARGTRKRPRTSTSRNPRQGKRRRADSENNEPTDGPSQATANSDEDESSDVPEIRDGMSAEEMYPLLRRLQAKVNDLTQARQEESRDALANITNSAAPENTEDDIEGKELAFIQSCGKKFTVTRMVWLPEDLEDEIFDAKTDPNYNDIDRFSTEDGEQPQNKIQGARKDLCEIIPQDYREEDQFDDWVQTAFLAGMNSQRSFTATRLRGHPDLFDCTSRQFGTSEGRSEFANLIGRREDDEGKYFYDTTNVPILHKDYNDKFDLDTFMLHPSLFVVHAAITKGPATATAIKNGTAAPKCESVSELWKLKKTTPGMIAADATWLRWVHSPDPHFTPVGSETGINWQEEFEYYLKYLTEGLQKKIHCVENIFRVWDQKFYPNSAEGRASGASLDESAAEVGRNAALAALNARLEAQTDGGE